MTSLLRSLRRGRRDITTLDGFAGALSAFHYGGNAYGFGGYPGLNTTYGVESREQIPTNLQGYAQAAYMDSGVVFAVMQVRMLVFSGVRFQWQRLENGRTGELFGSRDLAVLDNPWPGGTTQDLLSKMELDVTLAGNSYWVRHGDELVRLRPDWVEIICMPRVIHGAHVGYEAAGFAYWEGGIHNGREPALFTPREVAHYAPIPDPLANYRGMSWLTPVLSEIRSDKAMTRHREKFYMNAAPQPLDAPVLTPEGWSTMGAIRLGSEVIGSDGKPHRVTGVFPVGERDIYRVGFSDGSSVECTDDHLWAVQNDYDRRRGVTRTMSLRAVVENGLRYPSGPAKWAVPFASPVEFADPGTLPVDPYLLGLLLGDGSFRGNRRGSGAVTLASDIRDSDQIAGELRDRLPEGVTVTRRDRGGWSEFYLGAPKHYGCNPLTDAVRDLGLWDVPGPDKFVPEPYLRASVTERAALLQGLIDSDGSVATAQPNLVRFTSRSRDLANAVRELTRSLGGTASIAEVPAKGQWVTTVRRLPTWLIPCRLKRKSDLYEPLPEGAPRWRHIVSVEPVGQMPAQCIRVDVDDSLYITNDYVLTHNTPNLSISMDKSVTREQFEAFTAKFDDKYKGIDNAYKTMFLGGGADVRVIGTDFKAMDFGEVQGRGEAMVAAAGGVPAVIAGLVKGIEASTYCLPATEPVWTPAGRVPISEIKAGDWVWSHVDGGVAPRRVLWQGQTGEKLVYRIQTRNRVLHATGNHPVLVRRPGSMTVGSNDERRVGVHWKQVSELRVGDQVVQVASLPDLGGDLASNGERVTADLAQWLGMYVGDGCGVDHPRSRIALCVPSESRVLDHYAKLTEELFSPRTIKIAERYFGFHSMAARRRLRALGIRGNAKTKRVPGWVYGLRRDLQLAFLAGIVDSDGSVDKRGSLTVQLANRELVEDIKALLVGCDIQVSNLRYQQFDASVLPNPGARESYDSWGITASSADEVSTIPFDDWLYRERVESNVGRRRRAGGDAWKAGLSRDLGFWTIRAIEPDGVQSVYDIEVEGGHSFVASGVVVHNSNFSQARRRFADGTLHPLWMNAAGSLSNLVSRPPDRPGTGARLWYDAKQNPFLLEDRTAAAEIEGRKAATIRTLIDGGFRPESVIAAVAAEDFTLLQHTNLVSVQLLPPGTTGKPPATEKKEAA